MAPHSSTPFTYQPFGPRFIVIDVATDSTVGIVTAEADAKFICEACNRHERREQTLAALQQFLRTARHELPEQAAEATLLLEMIGGVLEAPKVTAHV